MTVSELLKTFLGTFVSDAVSKAEAKIPTLMPGLAGALLDEALSIPAVKGEIQKLESMAIDEVVALLGKGLSSLEQLILSHVHGRLGAWLQKELPLLATINVKLSQDEASGIAKLVEQGKLRDALHAAGVL